MLETAFLGMASTTVTLYPATASFTDYGAPQFSTTAQTYPAAVEFGNKKVISKNGVEEIATAVIYVMSSSATIDPNDRLVLPLSSAPSVIRVDTVNDEQGQHHLEVYCA